MRAHAHMTFIGKMVDHFLATMAPAIARCALDHCKNQPNKSDHSFDTTNGFAISTDYKGQEVREAPSRGSADSRRIHGAPLRTMRTLFRRRPLAPRRKVQALLILTEIHERLTQRRPDEHHGIAGERTRQHLPTLSQVFHRQPGLPSAARSTNQRSTDDQASTAPPAPLAKTRPPPLLPYTVQVPCTDHRTPTSIPVERTVPNTISAKMITVTNKK